jgi:hypothetical protein
MGEGVCEGFQVFQVAQSADLKCAAVLEALCDDHYGWPKSG